MDNIQGNFCQLNWDILVVATGGFFDVRIMI